jgi:hypothetical protein
MHCISLVEVVWAGPARCSGRRFPSLDMRWQGCCVSQLRLVGSALGWWATLLTLAPGALFGVLSAGSPTLGGHMPTQVSVALGAIMRERQAQALPCGVFGSFGCVTLRHSATLIHCRR